METGRVSLTWGAAVAPMAAESSTLPPAATPENDLDVAVDLTVGNPFHLELAA